MLALTIFDHTVQEVTVDKCGKRCVLVEKLSKPFQHSTCGYTLNICINSNLPLAFTHKTKGAFEGARGAIQAYGSLGSLNSSLSFVCGSRPNSSLLCTLCDGTSIYCYLAADC